MLRLGVRRRAPLCETEKRRVFIVSTEELNYNGVVGALEAICNGRRKFSYPFFGPLTLLIF